MRTPPSLILLIVVAAAAVTGAQSQEGFRFKSGVEFVNVTATVTDGDGRFVSGLRQEDFTVYEDGQVQDVSHFSSDRVPVSLGIALDTSGSMSPEKLAAARAAIERLIFKLLDQNDELFFVEFATTCGGDPGLDDRSTVDQPGAGKGRSRRRDCALRRGRRGASDCRGGAQPKEGAPRDLRRQRYEQLDRRQRAPAAHSRERGARLRTRRGQHGLARDATRRSTAGAVSAQHSLSVSGQRTPTAALSANRRRGRDDTWPRSPGERVNADALRQITDDTGGRTEIVRGFEGLDGATARIADELSKQYFLGYTSSVNKDGRWHSIRVTVRDRNLTVRARRGYVAS